MKMMPRILLLLFTLSVMTMVFIARCGLNIDNYFHQQGVFGPGIVSQDDLSNQMRREEQHHKEMDMLRQRIHVLERKLKEAYRQAQNHSVKVTNHNSTAEIHVPDTNAARTDYKLYFQNKIESAEILHGVSLKSEYELIPFNRFTGNRIFLIEPGLGKRVVEKPIGYKKKDLTEIIVLAVDKLNKDQTKSVKYTTDDFVEGIYRNEPTTGTHYELYFHDVDHRGMKNFYSKVIVMRPFGPLQVVHKNNFNTNKEWINLILPLSGRTETFKLFMERFAKVCILQDKRVYLTVVYFGVEGLADVRDVLSKVARQYKFKHIKLVTLKESFSRGRGLQIGTLNWKNGDVLMFHCDVDIVFGTDFLERCRLNTEHQKKVYYPIVFSLYNPNVVYSLHDMVIPPEKDQLVISRDTGFWRDFGYGMTCQYRSDFMKIKGFDEQITGWGGEDVFLYQKYVRSDYIVIRATDPGIFHLYHGKNCDPDLSSEQYRSCIRSKALNEASHAQLGLLAFKDEIDIHRSYKRRSSQ